MLLRRCALVTTLLLSVLIVLPTAAATPTETPPMRGVFFNAHPQVLAGGSAVLTGFDRANLGHLDFTALPDDTRTLCGAGDLIGERTEQSLSATFSATFTSGDTDPGCGFDHGGIFTTLPPCAPTSAGSGAISVAATPAARPSSKATAASRCGQRVPRHRGSAMPDLSTVLSTV